VNKYFSIGVLLALAVLASSSTTMFAANQVTHSAFIDGKVKLEKCPRRHGSYCYFSPDMNLEKFNRVHFPTIEYQLSVFSDYSSVNPEDYKKVSDMFRETLDKQLEPAYPVVSEVTTDTLVVRMALVDVKLKKGKSSLFTSSRIELADAVIEAELLDGGTGERLAVLVDQNLYEDGSYTESWESMQLIFKHYSKRLKKRLDDSRVKQSNK